MTISLEQKLDLLFSKYEKLQASLYLVNNIRDPVITDSPLLLATAQARSTINGFLSRISEDDDEIKKLSLLLDQAWDQLMPCLLAFVERQQLVAFDQASIDQDCEHFQGILPLDEDGLLPRGMHHTGWSEFTARFGQTDRRHRQTQGLLAALISLQNAGCKRAYVGGSFVTAKENPNDIDYIFEPQDMDTSKLEPMLDRNNYSANRNARGYYGIDGGAADIKYLRLNRQQRTIFDCELIDLEDTRLAHLGPIPRSRFVGIIALDLGQPLPEAKDFRPYCMWDNAAASMPDRLHN